MYIPSAMALTRGGYFVRRPGTDKFDTILSAQQILRSLVRAHGEQLAALPREGAAGGSLLELANAGLVSDSNVGGGAGKGLAGGSVVSAALSPLGFSLLPLLGGHGGGGIQ